MNDELDFNELGAAINDWLDNRPPPDVVPAQRTLTRDDLLALDKLAAQDRIPVVTAPQIVTDCDGIPLAVGEPETTESQLASVIVTRRQVEQAGLTADDVPNLKVVEK